jgi:predicted NUDIX family NTP pyrophosphohydrolase
MAAKTSAGILLYRLREGALEVLLAHPGGPFWTKRDLGSWTLPKGEIDEGEDALAAARREFAEETSIVLPDAPALALTPLRQPSRKLIHAWAIEGDCDAAACHSNLFQMEWPPKSGQVAEFPEIDRAEWFDLATASRKILPGQAPFLAELAELLAAR